MDGGRWTLRDDNDPPLVEEGRRLRLPYCERLERMARARLGGQTYKAIGEEFGVTTQRIRQILSSACFPTRKARRRECDVTTVAVVNELCRQMPKPLV